MTLSVALHEWTQFLESHGHSPRLNAPASPHALAEAEARLNLARWGLTFPDELRQLYLLANGSEGGLFLGYPLYTLDELVTAYAEWEDLIYGSGNMLQDSEDDFLYASEPPNAVQLRYWIPGWLPLCIETGGGNHIACDLSPAPAGNVGQLITMGPDEDNHVQLARSLSELFALSARLLERGELRIDDAGSWSTPNGFVAFNAFRAAAAK